MTMDARLHTLMDRLVGTWRTTGRITGGGEHDGATFSGVDVYEWFPGERQMVHRVDVEIFGGRTEAMEFLTPRAGSADTIDQASFDADGTVEHTVGTFGADGRYRIAGDGARATLTVDRPDAMHARWDSQAPDGRWRDWLDVAFARIGEPHIEVRSKTDHSV
ncbi:hypothetical protein [Georgenia faecalis]|uniref:DUF1579 domain-containing protein n=1 Tax=Georgenia faecalis TaxID=2483799 RepID=A0ABV9D956_9MICO|nr:hypothetical protein [Georgenia faecalis]